MCVTDNADDRELVILDAHELTDLSSGKNQLTCVTVAFIKIRESPHLAVTAYISHLNV